MQFIEMLLWLMDFGEVSTNLTILSKTYPLIINKFYLFAESTNIMTNAAGIAELAKNAGKLSFEAFNGNWVELGTGKSYIFLATVKVSLAFATILIAIWAVPFFNTIIKEGFSEKTINQLVYPLLVVFMLAIHNGSLLASTSLLFRNTINYVDNSILATTINGIKVEQAIRQSNLSSAFKQILSQKVTECRLQSLTEKNQNGVDLQTACVENTITEVLKSSEDYKAQNTTSGYNLNILDDLKKAVLGGVEGIAKLPAQYTNSAVQGALLIIFPTMQMGFVFLIEIASLINAYIAPIFVALSLIPGQGKLIHAWLSGWLGLALVKISYTLIIGIATSSIVNVDDTNPLLLPLLLGVLSPILALAIASGGGIALFNGLAGVASGSLRFLLTAAILRGKGGASVGVANSTRAEAVNRTRK
jgi:hypothetical protein